MVEHVEPVLIVYPIGHKNAQGMQSLGTHDQVTGSTILKLGPFARNVWSLKTWSLKAMDFQDRFYWTCVCLAITFHDSGFSVFQISIPGAVTVGRTPAV